MKYYHFKTVCKAGRTHTCNVSALNYHDAKEQAHEIFSTYYPEHGWVVYMSYRDYAMFNDIRWRGITNFIQQLNNKIMKTMNQHIAELCKRHDEKVKELQSKGIDTTIIINTDTMNNTNQNQTITNN